MFSRCSRTGARAFNSFSSLGVSKGVGLFLSSSPYPLGNFSIDRLIVSHIPHDVRVCLLTRRCKTYSTLSQQHHSVQFNRSVRNAIFAEQSNDVFVPFALEWGKHKLFDTTSEGDLHRHQNGFREDHWYYCNIPRIVLETFFRCRWK